MNFLRADKSTRYGSFLWKNIISAYKDAFISETSKRLSLGIHQFHWILLLYFHVGQRGTARYKGFILLIIMEVLKLSPVLFLF
jgi:hypothetical protein